MNLKSICSFLAILMAQNLSAQNYVYYHTPIHNPDIGIADENQSEFIQEKGIKHLLIDFSIQKKGAAKKVESKQYTYNEDGYITSMTTTNNKGEKISEIHLKLDDENRATSKVTINKKGDTSSRTITNYSESRQILDYSFYDKKGKEKYGQHYEYDGDKIIKHQYIRNDKPHTTYVYEYYPSGERMKTTSYNRKGKEKYIWRYECKEEGIEVKKHKDTSSVCIEKKTDESGNYTEVQVNTDEKGKIRTTVRVTNPSGKMIQYKIMSGVENEVQSITVREYEADTILLSDQYKSFSKNHRYEGNVRYNRQGQVVQKEYKRFKKDQVKRTNRIRYIFAKDGLPVKRESSGTRQNRTYFSDYSYVRNP